jgi:diadenosine tetraphosphate (Ap4A) HIT family hydrolase
MNEDDERWARLVQGIECPMDAPRPDVNDHWALVGKLTVSSLYLSKNQTYRGHCQLIFDPRHAARPDQLTAGEWAAWCADLFRAQGAIMRVVRADHINIETLGNVVPHLHWHIVPRYRNDPRWGNPIWLTSLADMIDTRISDEERHALIAEIRSVLATG